MTSRTLGDRLAELWSDERCDWRIEHHGEPWTSEATDPFLVMLEWTEEHDTPHGAAWATYIWQFYGATVEEALAEAVTWCEALAPWRPCSECDGHGAWQGTACDDCNGTGLAPANNAKEEAATTCGAVPVYGWSVVSPLGPRPQHGAWLPTCDIAGCDRFADWAYIGEGGDLYLCSLHGEGTEGWTWIGE